MSYNNKTLGAFIIPTGIGASIGGYAGDAGAIVRKFAKNNLILVNPNVVNAGCFSSITENMLYTEGYNLDAFFKGEINLIPSTNNKIGIIYDKAIPNDVLNIHINTHNAVKTVYGIEICEHVITDEEVGVDFFITEDGISTGNVRNIKTISKACQTLINSGCNAIAIVCFFEEPESDNLNYSNGIGTDPVGGVEAIISHYISKEFRIPCAHSPAFEDYSISTNIVSPKSAAEYITPTFLPCILLGLSQAPQITTDLSHGLNISNLDFLVYPSDCLGGVPIYEAIKRNIKIYSIQNNTTQLNLSKSKLFSNCDNIITIDSYESLLDKVNKL